MWWQGKSVQKLKHGHGYVAEVYPKWQQFTFQCIFLNSKKSFSFASFFLF